MRVSEKVVSLIEEADAIVIGAGAGLSTAAGLIYTGERFDKYFKEFIVKYGMSDMYSAGFYPFQTQEEKWAYWSRHIYYNRYDIDAGKVYMDLLHLVKDKNYFVITTNVDHQFELAGFKKERLFATQGDYGLFQCAEACHNKLYDNEAAIRQMIVEQKTCKIPVNLVPKCPVCGGEMEVNLRCDSYFVEDDSWHASATAYQNFIKENKDHKILFIELGVGMNTPVIIKYPFWRMTNQFRDAFYLCINLDEAWVPEELKAKSLSVAKDIFEVLRETRKYGKNGGNDENESR